MSKFNFDQMIDDLAKEKGISKTKFDQVAENIETIRINMSPLTLLADSGEFGTVKMVPTDKIFNMFVDEFNLSLEALTNRGENISKIISLFSESELNFLNLYSSFTVVMQSTETQFKKFITCFAFDETMSALPLEFFIYFDGNKIRSYIPKYENTIGLPESSVKNVGINEYSINHFCNSKLNDKSRYVDNLIFYEENAIQLKNIGTIEYNPEFGMNEGVRKIRKHIGKITLDGPLAKDFMKSHLWTEKVCDLYVFIDDNLASLYSDLELYNLFQSIDWNNNPKIQNAFIDLEKNTSGVILKIY